MAMGYNHLGFILVILVTLGIFKSFATANDGVCVTRVILFTAEHI